ncbi:MAG: oligopeptidase B, partial [Armatimonadetes bacterium]|nr:oligopeptidase B [Armatimonadota bacterium]
MPILRPDSTTPPVCETRPHTHNEHNDPRPDPYFWLREKETPEVTAYLEAENAYTDAVFLKPTESLRETLYKEILGRIQETDLS